MSDAPQGPGWWQAADGKWYAPAAPPPAAAPAKKGGCFRWIGIAVVGLIALVVVIAVVAATGSDDGDTPGAGEGTTENPAIDDVTITECEVDAELQIVTVRGEIVNHSSERSNYLFSVNIEDAEGTKLGEANGIENNIDPDQRAEWEIPGTVSSAPTDVTCELADVTRLASD